MAESRGRPLVALSVVIVVWIAGRAAQLQMESSLPVLEVTPLTTSVERDMPVDAALAQAFSAELTSPPAVHRVQPQARSTPVLMRVKNAREAPEFDYPEPMNWFALAPQQMSQTRLSRSRDDEQPIVMSAPNFIPSPEHSSRKRLAFYGYSFWRNSQSAAGIAPAGQYGGSQSGLIATYILGEDETAPALLGRVSVSPSPNTDREVALGIRWQPMAKLPVALSAERRFRSNGTDTFALYVAGGENGVQLPLGFELGGYAQAGILTDKKRTSFFDANMRIKRTVIKAGRIRFLAGGGAWSGGQTGAARLDIGPSLSAELPVGDTQYRIEADWRFRVAGQATPVNGPTLTVTTSF